MKGLQKYISQYTQSKTGLCICMTKLKFQAMRGEIGNNKFILPLIWFSAIIIDSRNRLISVLPYSSRRTFLN